MEGGTELSELWTAHIIKKDGKEFIAGYREKGAPISRTGFIEWMYDRYGHDTRIVEIWRGPTMLFIKSP